MDHPEDQEAAVEIAAVVAEAGLVIKVTRMVTIEAEGVPVNAGEVEALDANVHRSARIQVSRNA